LSSTKSKFRILLEVPKEGKLAPRLVQLGMNNATFVPMHYNNGSCIKIAKDLVYHSKTKPFAIHFKYIQQFTKK
jgi:hypothetical protein